ncbi:membrane lipoprotein [Halorhabdus tiamatea SARL4B]|uniref:Membrane lipoprotein n=2 Tax=Halorhabdus TaxID=146825 RepID=U2F5Q6_9EURY|nr:hypothetical protein [Halorhabdus tiamatea]ERJ05585.1 membrane lipoprotein [Halorhabdus tiamatea SARL4B]
MGRKSVAFAMIVVTVVTSGCVGFNTTTPEESPASDAFTMADDQVRIDSVCLLNGDDTAHSITVEINNGSAEVYNDTHDLTAYANGSTGDETCLPTSWSLSDSYRIRATDDTSSEWRTRTLENGTYQVAIYRNINGVKVVANPPWDNGNAT